MSAAAQEVVDAIHAWDRAMITNDDAAIASSMADDWVCISPDGSVGERAPFLELVRSGVLTHDVMESHEISVRVYGDTAVVHARGISGGKHQGQPFHLVERVSCVFVKQLGHWKCVLTHLSQMQ
ncbi:MAG: nuclear transport factor 2 family protein [Polyangiales bacterium]